MITHISYSNETEILNISNTKYPIPTSHLSRSLHGLKKNSITWEYLKMDKSSFGNQKDLK